MPTYAPLVLNRSDLTRLFPNDIKAQLAFEQLFARVTATGEAVTAGTDATTGINNATVVTLSANDVFANERILSVGPGITITDNGPSSTVVLALLCAIATTGGYRLTLNLNADTNIGLPVGGNIPSSLVGPYANDAAAAGAGVQIGDIYKLAGGTVVWRQT